MNFAANLDLPVVFVCQNNSWAISVPTRIQCSAPTIAQRGLAYGMHSVQVDGNDIFAMVKVVREAAESELDVTTAQPLLRQSPIDSEITRPQTMPVAIGIPMRSRNGKLVIR